MVLQGVVIPTLGVGLLDFQVSYYSSPGLPGAPGVPNPRDDPETFWSAQPQ